MNQWSLTLHIAKQTNECICMLVWEELAGVKQGEEMGWVPIDTWVRWHSANYLPIVNTVECL